MGKFTIFTGNDGQYYFNLKAGNGEVILRSEGYKAKAGCDNGIASVKKNAGDGKYETKTAANGKEFFVLKAGNGEVIGTSQMYATGSGCANGIESVKKNAADAEIIEE